MHDRDLGGHRGVFEDARVNNCRPLVCVIAIENEESQMCYSTNDGYDIISTISSEAGEDKPTPTNHIVVKVQWFSVKIGYGLITRDNTQEHAFVRVTAMTCNSTLSSR